MPEAKGSILPPPEVIRKRAADHREYKINAATAELEVLVADQLLDLEETVSMPIGWGGADSQTSQEILDHYSPEVLNVAANRVATALVSAGYRILKAYSEDGRAYIDISWEKEHSVPTND